MADCKDDVAVGSQFVCGAGIPSAIEKSGTNINSNNPGLNIPGTPTNLI